MTGEVPATFTATTVNEYDVLGLRPVTVAEVASAATVAVAPPGAAVTTYFVQGAPPSEAGGVHDTIAPPYPACAVTFCATDGATGCTAITSWQPSTVSCPPLTLRAVRQTVCS